MLVTQNIHNANSKVEPLDDLQRTNRKHGELNTLGCGLRDRKRSIPRYQLQVVVDSK